MKVSLCITRSRNLRDLKKKYYNYKGVNNFYIDKIYKFLNTKPKYNEE